MLKNRLISAAFSIVCLVYRACSTDSKTENITPTSETLLPASRHVMTKDHSEEIRKAATGVTKHLCYR